jgi:hypothetical protein
MEIANMDRIYSAAELTIVAAAGKDPSYGLSGVSTRLRPAQPTLRTESGLIFPILRSPQQLTLSSTWHSRAWTYQEGFLSRRRLYFTEEQVFFECQASLFEETPTQFASLSLDRLVDDSPLKDLRRNSFLRPPLFSVLYKRDYQTLWSIIHGYSKRNLTFQHDTLNAILGIFKSFARGNDSIFSPRRLSKDSRRRVFVISLLGNPRAEYPKAGVPKLVVDWLDSPYQMEWGRA